MRSIVVLFFLLKSVSETSSFSLFSKLAGLLPSPRYHVPQPPTVSLLVEIPIKPLDVTAGGRFQLETPMELHAYSSAGRSNLHQVRVVYLMQSMYRPNHMCFFLHFWSMKDPTVPWDARRLNPPYWAKNWPS